MAFRYKVAASYRGNYLYLQFSSYCDFYISVPCAVQFHALFAQCLGRDDVQCSAEFP